MKDFDKDDNKYCVLNLSTGGGIIACGQSYDYAITIATNKAKCNINTTYSVAKIVDTIYAEEVNIKRVKVE